MSDRQLFFEFEKQKARLEAVLFACGDPVPVSRLSEVLEVPEDAVHLLAEALCNDLAERGSALEAVRLGNGYQLCTRAEFAGDIRKALDIHRNVPLSQAALEVLAVIAYHQPVTRAYVEQVRGVDCSGVMTGLLEKGLIEEKGRLELPGRPLLYGTTDNFLRSFELEDLSRLPPLPKDRPEDETAPEDAREEVYATVS